MTVQIPFLDILSSNVTFEDELISVFKETLKSGRFIGGPMLEGFEEDFANYCKAPYCVGVSSGTDALRFALMAAGVGSEDIILTVPNTFIATTEAITQAGALPHFVDIDPHTYNICLERLEEYINTSCKFDQAHSRLTHEATGKTVKAIIPVHLYGQPAEMDGICALADRFHLHVIEDACQAHGAEYYSNKQQAWLTAGSMGLAAAFSFYPGKNLGAFGEGGAVVTEDEAIANQVSMLRDHGQIKKYYHEVEGYNGRLDAIQAGILKIKLGHLDEWNAHRRSNAAQYTEQLQAIEAVTTPDEPTWTRPVYHLYVIRVENRDELQRFLTEQGIGTGLHYPVPLHLQTAYSYLGYNTGDFPVAEKVANEILSLPMSPLPLASQIDQVVDAIKAFYS